MMLEEEIAGLAEITLPYRGPVSDMVGVSTVMLHRSLGSVAPYS